MLRQSKSEHSRRQVLDAAGELSKQAETLRSNVDSFLDAVRAA